MAKQATNEEIDAFLATKCSVGGWEGSTWREWLADCLITLLEEGEGFSGKRPNCDSGWELGVIKAFKKVRATSEQIVERMVAPHAPAASGELPEPWEWQEFDDGSHAVSNGVRVACESGLVRIVGDYGDAWGDAPIAVVLAVIARISAQVAAKGADK